MPTKTSKKKKPSKTKQTPTRKQAPKKKAARKTAPLKKAAPKKKKALKRNTTRGKSQGVDSVVFEPKGLGARSGGQSGDLQGLSNREGADSESVDELLEEGNAFEAEVVKGVEDVPDADEGEVRTHEVPENDVPDEYLEKDE
ncbi:MAG TPA: hypothetical protein VN087_04880 [Verrucomicrobiae bacterium]|jgi:hypothetical protein|nr:hypothetical protein [Verrucomicrobiae bacterium]